MFIEEFLLQLPGKVLASLISTAFLAALAMTSRSIRSALFYTRHEFGFDYTSSWQSCAWDIQWEGFRVTVVAESVHNDYIEKVTIKKNHENPGLEFKQMQTSDSFQTIEGWPLQFKLNSIIRAIPMGDAAGNRLYRLLFVFRRRRW